MKKGVESNQKKEELSLLEENLIDCIKDWQESGKDPCKNLELLKEYAGEFLAIALKPIPCWERLKASSLQFPSGLYDTPNGKALVQDGYFVMVDDLVENLPRTLDQ